MWDEEVRIGTGNRLNSAWTCYEIPNGPRVSHNEVSYWISDCILHIGMTIMKDTSEGEELTKLLRDPCPEVLKQELVERWLNHTALRHIGPGPLMTRIKYATEEAFRAGKEAKTEEIRKVLGV